MRLYTPAPVSFSRVAKMDHYIGDDLFIKKGTYLIVGIMGNMSNPDYFVNPDEFNPDRW